MSICQLHVLLKFSTYVARIWFNSDDTPFENASIVKSLQKIIN